MIVQRLFKAQLSKPTKGDWFNTIKDDLKLIHEDIESFDEERIKSMQLKTYNKFIKAAFDYLEADKSKKSKVMNINYEKFSIQKYIASKNFQTKRFTYCQG